MLKKITTIIKKIKKLNELKNIKEASINI